MNNQGICDIACMPVRSIPSERGEMVTQLLFGECYQILEEENNFTRICIDHDQYEGWISNVSVSLLKFPVNKKSIIVSNVFTRVRNLLDNNLFIIPGGSEVTKFESNLLSFEINNAAFSFIESLLSSEKMNVFDLARQYLGSPYLWGGKTHMGIDCSGLVQVVFKMKNVFIPRDASQQEKTGKQIPRLNDAMKGDLAFFKNNEGKIIHVGILDGIDSIIHSSGKVKIEKITEEGIVFQESEIISHKLHSIKRIQV